MPHTLMRQPRIIQTAHCCGAIYSRWKPATAADFPPGHTHCCHCGNPLHFRSHLPLSRRPPRAVASAASRRLSDLPTWQTLSTIQASHSSALIPLPI